MKPATVLICVAALLRSLIGGFLGFQPFDDSYITFRYALNLATGHGFVYNWGQHVLGTTTPLWTLVLVPAVWLHLPIGAYAICMSLACDLATAQLLYFLLEALDFGPEVGAAAAILFLLLIDYLALSLSGMESSLFVFLIIATLYYVVLRRWLLGGCLLGFAVLTRPDGAALGVAVTAAALLQWRAGESTHRIWSALLVTMAVVLPWVVIAALYFGTPIPQSVLAKYQLSHGVGLRSLSNHNLLQFVIHGQFGMGILTRTYWQGQIILTGVAAMGVFVLLKSAYRDERQGRLAVAALVAFPAVYAFSMGAAAAFTWHPWYYAPFYPFLAALAAIGALHIGRLVGRARLAPICLVIVIAACQALALIKVKLPAISRDVWWTEGWEELASHIPRDANVTVAANEVGVLGWTAYPVTVYDMIGLVSPSPPNVSLVQRLHAERPAYIALRVDASGDLLIDLGKTDWFASEYSKLAESADQRYVIYISRAQVPPK